MYDFKINAKNNEILILFMLQHLNFKNIKNKKRTRNHNTFMTGKSKFGRLISTKEVDTMKKSMTFQLSLK